MAITIKEIAKLAGVSVGTVDRALHNRGRVNSELAKRINEIAKENKFEPSWAGRALALAKKPIKIGIITHLAKFDFMRDVILGIEKAVSELESIGVEIVIAKLDTMDAEREIEIIDDMVKKGVQGIAISPISGMGLKEKMDSVFREKKIPFVTFNTDMAESERVCFVGMDNERSGRVAAGLLSVMVPNGGKVGVISGHNDNIADNQRIKGFLREMESISPGIKISDIAFCNDDDNLVEKITEEFVNEGNLVGIFIASGGQRGLCKALEKLDALNTRVVAYDVVPATVEGLKMGAIDFVIDQNTFLQGYKPTMILFELLFNKNEIDKKLQYTDIVIRNRYNLSQDII